MTLYDDMMEGVIDVHCHIDFEFSAQERKREPEFLWLPKAEAMGMRGVVLKSHWWPTVNVTPYILSSVQTNVALWSSVALNITGMPGLHDRLKADLVESVDHRVKVIQRVLVGRHLALSCSGECIANSNTLVTVLIVA